MKRLTYQNNKNLYIKIYNRYQTYQKNRNKQYTL